MNTPPRDPARDWEPEVVAARRGWLGLELPHLAGAPVPTQEARGNVEGLVGFAQVPVGVAAPLLLRGDAEGEYRVPFATTEGTMVASYQRGFKVLALAGGVNVRVLRDGLVVWPTLTCPTVDDALAASRWVGEHVDELRGIAEATTRHGKVVGLTTELLGRRLVLRLEMTTGDAHGINLVTRAAQSVAERVPGGGRVLVHGYDVEKRGGFERGRGKGLVAEAVVPADLVAAHWKVPASALAEAWHSYLLSFARMGTPTCAIQVANGLAGIYLATGQDVAYLAESAACTLSVEDRGGDLYASLDLPNLHAATVGGGTQKGTAAECQRIVGAKDARELACVIAGALLAGDLNLLASFLDADYSGAHERLGRNRPPTGRGADRA